MNEPKDFARQAVDRQAAQWLASGPDRAPEGLLATAMDATSRSRQRPTPLAVMLGAPRLGRATRSLTMTRQLILVALATVAVIAVMAFVGTQRPDLLVVAPSPGPSPTSGPQATLQPTPVTQCMFAPELPCTPSVRDVVDLTIGFEFDGGSEWSNLPDGSTSRRRFGHGKCWDGICNKGYVTVSAFPVDKGFTVPADPAAGGAPATRIGGATLAKLERAWLDTFPDSTADAADVDGVPAIVVHTPTSLYVLAIKYDRVYGFTSAGPAFFGQSAPSSLSRDSNLMSFLSGFHFRALVEPSPGAE